MSPRELGRLLRVSLAPSAAADAAAGILLGAGGLWPDGAGPWMLMGASLSVYTGALALNDWADRGHDAATRPDRPIPSGGVSAPAALGLGGGLVALGVALAFGAGPSTVGPWMLGVALLAVGYDLGLRGPFAGPLLLAACRAGNLGAGLVLAGARPGEAAFAAPLLYGLYVFLASRLGRMEDAEDRLDGARARRLVLGAAAVLVALPIALYAALPPSRASWLPLEALPLAAAAWGLLAAARTQEWTLPQVMRTMGLLLRRLLVISAAVALAAWRFEAAGSAPFLVAGAILAGYPLSHRLRRVFPPS